MSTESRPDRTDPSARSRSACRGTGTPSAPAHQPPDARRRRTRCQAIWLVGGWVDVAPLEQQNLIIPDGQYLYINVAAQPEPRDLAAEPVPEDPLPGEPYLEREPTVQDYARATALYLDSRIRFDLHGDADKQADDCRAARKLCPPQPMNCARSLGILLGGAVHGWLTPHLHTHVRTFLENRLSTQDVDTALAGIEIRILKDTYDVGEAAEARKRLLKDIKSTMLP